MRYTIKYLSILLFMCVVALYMPFYTFASVIPQIEGSNVSSQVGEQVEVVFDISEAENVCGGNFNIVYNTEYLQIVSAKAGDVFKNSAPVINTKYESGKIRVTWAGITPIEQSGELIVVKFLVKEGTPSGDLFLDIEALRLYDYDAQVIEAQAIRAKINVKNTYLVMIPENNGDKVSVSVNLEGDTNCLGGSFVLAYDNSALIPVSAGKGILLTGATVTNNLSYTSNAVKVSWAGIEPVCEKGEIFKLVFDVVEGFTGTVSFTIKDTTLYDENSKVLAVWSEESKLDITETVAQTPHITVEKVKTLSEGTLAVGIEKNSMLCGGSIEIVYDNTAVEILDVTFGEVLTGRTPILNDTYEQNVIKLTWASALPMTVSGDILNITFKVIDTSKIFAAFDIRNLNLYDENMQLVEGSYENGGVIISCESEDCATITSFRKEDGFIVFDSYIFNNTDQATLFIALYKDNKLVNCGVQDVAESGYVNLKIEDCEFDSGKVMLWDGWTLMTPLTKVELLNND